MKILALDTATELCSAALLIDGNLISREQEAGRAAAELILPMIDSLLSEAGLGLRALDAVAFGRGPGGFTGVRLAASVTQGLAFGADLPVVPISDLAAVALRAFETDIEAARVLVCNDARMRQVYWACFQRSGTVVPLIESGEHVDAPSAIPPFAGSGVVGAGLGFKVYPELGRLVSRAHEQLLPRAAEIAKLAVDAGRLPAEQALPVYVRDEVASVSS